MAPLTNPVRVSFSSPNQTPRNSNLEYRLESFRAGGDTDDDDDEEDDGPEANICRARLGTHGRGNSRPLANLPLPVFPQRCDAPPELPRATADMSCFHASFERGNAGPDGKSHLRDSSKQWDLVKSGRSQKLGKRKREDSKDAARLAEPMEMSGPSEFER